MSTRSQTGDGSVKNIAHRLQTRGRTIDLRHSEHAVEPAVAAMSLWQK